MRTDVSVRDLSPDKLLTILKGILLVCIVCTYGLAQSANNGTVSGRIYNPASGQYLRNAVIRIEETGQSVSSGDGGYFSISSVTPGARTLVVNFTGLVPARTAINVAPGQTTNQEIHLTSTGGNEATISLERFVVTSERQGNAKAIMEQRNSMNIQNSVASETFGDVSEGNVGEFMKHLPGVDVEFNADKIRYVRLRGLGAEYTSVTLDGVSLPASDAAGAAGDARAFNFEQLSLSSIDAIEVLKTVSADQDANAPAGTINLRSKRGFDRKGRRIAWQANISGFAAELTFKRTPGPDDRRTRKLLPGGSLEYSDVFFDDRVAIVAIISRSNVYSNPSTMGATYNYATTAGDQRPVVPTALTISNSSRTNEVFSSSFTADVRVTPSLIVSLGALYSTTELWNLQRNNSYQALTRSRVVGTDPLREFSAGTGNGLVRTQSNGINKQGENITYLPRFEYKHGNLTLDGRFSLAQAKTSYFPNSRGSVFNAGLPELTGVDFTARRSHYSSADWNISQTGGLDWSNGRFFTGPPIASDDGRLSKAQIYSGDIAATLRTTARVPVTWKAGVKRKREVRDYEVTRSLKTYNYIGPGAGTGAWNQAASPWPIDASLVGATARSLSGGNAFLVNTLDVYDMFRETPQYFTSSVTPANFYDAYVAGPKDYVEDINAAFAMGTANLGKRLQLRAGIRYEETKGNALELDPLTAAQVRAAGYQVSAGRATTIPGIAYQYLSKPRVHRLGGYDNFFPSSSIKYKFSERFDAHFGYSKTIRRPNFRDIAGIWEVDDTRLRVSAPNPNLTPEMSDNLSARIAYYHEPVGILAVNFFENTVKGLYISSEMTPEEYGYTGELDLTDYTIISTVSGKNRIKIRGMELEYSQSLSFLRKPFDGFNVRASYTRNQAEVTLPEMAGHAAKAGLSYGKRAFNVYANLSWFDSIPLNAAGTSYRRHRTSIDTGASYRLSPKLNVFLSARNVSNAPLMTMQKTGANPAVVTSYLVLGTVLNLGVQGTF